MYMYVCLHAVYIDNEHYNQVLTKVSGTLRIVLHSHLISQVLLVYMLFALLLAHFGTCAPTQAR